ncbi:MAG: ATP-binding protein [Holosporaceae bacterium]|jgi:hypothetical protein|nr:ATP-binding protein [Holosporaceae bacterium]
MINSVTFNNFRSFDGLTIPLSQITMLTGTNCVGKTSVLEGLFCLFSETRLDVLSLSRYNQAIDFSINKTINSQLVVISKKTYNYKLFWNECPTYGQETCSVEAKDDNNFTRSWSYKRANIADLDSEMISGSPVQIDSLTEFALWHWITCDENNKIKHQTEPPNDQVKRAQIIVPDGGLYLLPATSSATSKAMNSICRYVDFASIRLTLHKLPFFMSLLLTEALKIINPKITDVRFTSTESGLSVVLDGKYPVALETLGNGAVIWANTLITIFDVADKFSTNVPANMPALILIDEIGAGIHYSVMSDIWKYLKAFVEKYPFIQFVVTSHNGDCVRAFCEAFSNEDKATVVRLHKTAEENKIVPTAYSQKHFSNIISGNWEVRG